MILLHTFTKTGINLATRLELPGRSPSHDANSRLLCSEFHARMKRISRANEANFTRECMESQMVQNSPGFHRRVIIKTPFS